MAESNDKQYMREASHPLDALKGPIWTNADGEFIPHPDCPEVTDFEERSRVLQEKARNASRQVMTGATSLVGDREVETISGVLPSSASQPSRPSMQMPRVRRYEKIRLPSGEIIPGSLRGTYPYLDTSDSEVQD